MEKDLEFYEDTNHKVAIGELSITTNYDTLEKTQNETDTFFYQGGEEGDTWGTFSIAEAKKLVKFLNKSIKYLEEEKNL